MSFAQFGAKPDNQSVTQQRHSGIEPPLCGGSWPKADSTPTLLKYQNT